MTEKPLIAMIVQDARTQQVLSLVWANDESLEKMKETGEVWRYSRSHARVMKKGGQSGNTQRVVSTAWDCDQDALLVKVIPAGPACHTGAYSCFNEPKGREWAALDDLAAVIRKRKNNPTEESYTSKLVNDANAIGEKLREEADELAQGIVKKDKGNVAWEAADVLYFTFLALENAGVDMQAALTELAKRRKNTPSKQT